MTPMPSLSHVYGAFTLTLATTRRGPAVTMCRDGAEMPECREGLFLGGSVHYHRPAPEGRAEYVAFCVKDVHDPRQLIEVLTNPDAGLLVDAADAAGEVAALRGWLRMAIKEGQDWLEAVA